MAGDEGERGPTGLQVLFYVYYSLVDLIVEFETTG